MDNSTGLMGLGIMESFLKMTFMGKVHTLGMMEERLLANGRKIKWMARVFIFGQVILLFTN